MSTLAASIGSIALGLTFVALAALELRRRAPVPLGASLVAGGAVLAAAVAAAGPVNETALVRQLRHGGGFTAYLLVVLTVALVPVLRRSGLSRLQAALVTEPVLFVAAMSWVPAGQYAAGLRGDAGSRALTCVLGPSPVDVLSRWLIRTDLLPNVALYIPVGVAIALVAARPRWLAVVAGAGLSALTELWQALATNRLCAPSDLLANTVGTALGVAVVGVVVVAATALHGDRAAGRRRPVRQDGGHDG